MPTIKTEALSHIYGQGTPFESHAINNISLEIPQGQFVGLIGHTGSGKSTFIQHLNGLLQPESGHVYFDGVDINSSKQLRRNARFQVGLVFQYPEHQLFEETVYKDLAFGPRNMKLSKEETDERVREAARFAGLSEELFSKSPLELSGGQKRRAAIAGVIAMRPQVLVLDEPTAGLDPAGRNDILENIRAYHKASGATIILVSHSMDELAQIAQRLIVFDEGNIVMDGPPEKVFLHSEKLCEIGLGVPLASEIALELQKLGLNIPEGCYTVSSLRDAILSLRREAGVC
jgi:energy-coupling factor transport system ATP-binding protein